MIKNKNGITLIALIITAIVLLILAGVSLTLISGENGILTKAKNAKENTNIGREKEIVSVAASGALMKDENYIVKRENLEEELNQLIGEGKYELEESNVFTVTYNDSRRSYNVDKSGNVFSENNSSTEIKWIYEENENGDIEITGIDLSDILIENGGNLGSYSKKAFLGIETLVIPSEIEGKTVVKVDWKNSIINEGDRGCYIEFKYIKNVIYGDSIEEIFNTYPGTDFCFVDAQAIHLPNNLKILGDWALSGCTSLESIDIPSGVTNIGKRAFIKCKALQKIVIPESVRSIGYEAFRFCSGLKTINILEGLTSIEYKAFGECSSLETINLPESLISIGNYAFAYCDALETINLPENINSIGESVFLSCDSLKTVNIPKGVLTIKTSTFSSCSALETINIPESVISIGDYAFAYCDALENINILGKVTSIGYEAFACCGSLKCINIPNSVEDIDERAFYSCYNLILNFPNGKNDLLDIDEYYWGAEGINGI